MTTARTVTRVVDYEPRIPPPAAAALRRPSSRTAHLHAARRHCAPPSDAHRAAGAFADAALRTVLEVIDRRRPAVQLGPMMAAGLADSVVAFARAARVRQDAAVLRRVRMQACGSSEHAFEVAAGYSRGPRLHAIACRVEQVGTPEDGRWQIVALHIG